MEQTRLGSRHGQRVWGKAMRVGQQTSDGRVAREGGMEDTGHRLPRVARPIVVAPAAIIVPPAVVAAVTVVVPTAAVVVARAAAITVVVARAAAITVVVARAPAPPAVAVVPTVAAHPHRRDLVETLVCAGVVGRGAGGSWCCRWENSQKAWRWSARGKGRGFTNRSRVKSSCSSHPQETRRARATHTPTATSAALKYRVLPDQTSDERAPAHEHEHARRPAQ